MDCTIADVTKTAVVYLRISQDRTGEEAGVSRQREDCVQRCADRGWPVHSVESDNDQSASTARRRPGFDRVLSAIESGQVGVVVAWSLDRLQRNRRDEARLYEACQAHGVMLSLVKGADLEFGNAAGRFVADSLGSVARLEVQMKSERQQRANEQAAKAGRRVGGRRAFGYEPDGMRVRDGEAVAVRDGYSAVLAGVALGEVARAWNAKGHVTGQGNAWTRDTVRGVLLNPRYAGLRGYGPTPAKGRRKIEVVGRAVWPGVVGEDTWRAAVAVLTDPSRARPPMSARALLTGLARCGLCGATVHGGGAAKGQGKVYRCREHAHLARSAEPVEEYVAAVVVERLSRPDAADLLVDSSKPDVAALRDDATALRARMDSLAVEFADGELTASQLRAASERLRSRLAAVEAEMADAGRADVLGPLVTADDVRAGWDGLSVARRRAVIDALMAVTVYPPGRGTRTFRPETVQINWR